MNFLGTTDLTNYTNPSWAANSPFTILLAKPVFLTWFLEFETWSFTPLDLRCILLPRDVVEGEDTQKALLIRGTYDGKLLDIVLNHQPRSGPDRDLRVNVDGFLIGNNAGE